MNKHAQRTLLHWFVRINIGVRTLWQDCGAKAYTNMVTLVTTILSQWKKISPIIDIENFGSLKHHTEFFLKLCPFHCDLLTADEHADMKWTVGLHHSDAYFNFVIESESHWTY